MLPSNQRSSSTRPSRSTHHRTNSSSNNGARAYIIRRAVSVPQRQFIFILTNHPDLLQQTQVAQTLVSFRIIFLFNKIIITYCHFSRNKEDH